ncbi:hypothetical protein R1flu_027708 [Riccia fluitans]|uniref:VOC domain-containing protein n=1 Tax=Riccia fluitans TaxID=41844 RepID=A0ABD1XJP2_9MARC
MTPCVAMGPDSRMDCRTATSHRFDNIHGRMSSDLDPSFLPGVGLITNVDVLSVYMTAAAEIVAESSTGERASPYIPTAPTEIAPDSTSPTSEVKSQAPPNSKSYASFKEGELVPEPQDSERGLQKETRGGEFQQTAPVTDDLVELSSNSFVVKHFKEFGETGLNSKLEIDQALVPVVNQDKRGAIITEVPDFDNPVISHVTGAAEVAKTEDMKLLAKGIAEILELSTYSDGDEGRFEVIDRQSSMASGDTSSDRQEGRVVEGSELHTQAHSNPGTESLDRIGNVDEAMGYSESPITPAPAAEEKEAALTKSDENSIDALALQTKKHPFQFTGLNHVAFCCESLERSLEFYCGVLGLETNLDRPELPYRGAWLLLGSDGIHIMEVDNPDPVKSRPAHGGWDRHACLNVKNIDQLRVTLEKAGIEYQPSMVPSIFCRDPDGNGLEFIEV